VVRGLEPRRRRSCARAFSRRRRLHIAVRGKAALREYWHTAIKAIPNLHFDIVGVYEGASVLVINYRNQGGTLVNEVLEFDGGLVRRGHGTYLVRG
jgi:hypothetical protein